MNGNGVKAFEKELSHQKRAMLRIGNFFLECCTKIEDKEQALDKWKDKVKWDVLSLLEAQQATFEADCYYTEATKQWLTFHPKRVGSITQADKIALDCYQRQDWPGYFAAVQRWLELLRKSCEQAHMIYDPPEILEQRREFFQKLEERRMQRRRDGLAAEIILPEG